MDRSATSARTEIAADQGRRLRALPSRTELAAQPVIEAAATAIELEVDSEEARYVHLRARFGGSGMKRDTRA
jgi:hypothetical protein